MQPEPLACTKCRKPLPAADAAALTACPACGGELHVDVFPAFYKPLAPGRPAERVGAELEASCFHHPDKRAAVACDACGRFLCTLCDLELDGRHLCPVCLQSARVQGTVAALQTERVSHDGIALALALYPMLIFWVTPVSAPVALWFTVRAWRKPADGIPRSRARLYAAGILASLQIAGWLALAVALMV